jgi:hypothetical protein
MTMKLQTTTVSMAKIYYCEWKQSIDRSIESSKKKSNSKYIEASFSTTIVYRVRQILVSTQLFLMKIKQAELTVQMSNDTNESISR